jgi:hypothetical protein
LEADLVAITDLDITVGQRCHKEAQEAFVLFCGYWLFGRMVVSFLGAPGALLRYFCGESTI